MRVHRVRTDNFAGLGSIELTDLDAHRELFVSGRNGIGKSQLLLVIALVTRNEVLTPEIFKYIGPNGRTATVRVEFRIEDSEREKIVDLARERGDEQLRIDGDLVIAELVISRVSHPYVSWSDSTGDSSVTSIMSDSWSRANLPFATVTYLPADRMVSRSKELTLSLSGLARTKTLDLGQATLAQSISDWDQLHNFDVFSSLAALHYAGMLDSRSGGGPSQLLEDFRSITMAFLRATGKQITEPSITEDGSIEMHVELPGGHRHGVNTLSSGELIALQLLHFVRLHFHRGSILLVDEPEQHLHPSLQVEIVDAVRSESGAGQLLVATHSPSVLNAVPGNDVLVLSRDNSSGLVRTQFADSEERRVDLLYEIGVAPGLWLPGNIVLVVEGSTDELLLRKIMPDRAGQAFFVVAGDSSSVKSLAHRMRDGGGLPFLAIRDRDGIPDADRDIWNENPAQFMWSGYAIESILLDEAWLAATLGELNDAWTRTRVNLELARVFEGQRAQAERRWVHAEVIRNVPSRDDHKLELSEGFAQAAAVATERADYAKSNSDVLSEKFNAAWNNDPLRFVDPKRALREFQHHSFKSYDVFIAAMISKLKRSPEVQPSDLTLLGEKIDRLRGADFAEESETPTS